MKHRFRLGHIGPLVLFALCHPALGPSGARAEARASIRLSLDACPSLAAERVRSIVGAELGDLLIALEDTETVARMDVSVACVGTATTLSATDVESGQAMLREVTLDDVHPLARERFVALAISELIASIGADPEPPPVSAEPEVVVDPPAPTDEEPELRPEAAAPDDATRPRSRALAIAGRALVLGDPVRGAYGVGVRFERRVGARLGFAITLDVARSEVAEGVGTISTFETLAGFDLTYGVRAERFAVDGFVGVGAGLVRFDGDTDDPLIYARTFAAPLIVPRVGARGRVVLSARWFLTLGLELGVVALAAHASIDGVRTVSIAGATLTGQLGFGVSL